MHRLTAALATIVLVAACGEGPRPSPSIEDAYLHDGSFRRRALVASLVEPSNAYSRLRLARYATGDANDWDRAPEWNPRVSVVQVGESDLLRPLDGNARPLDLESPTLGEDAFFRYPVQVIEGTLPRDLDAYGLWSNATRGLGGVVRFALADGSTAIALTCASCHAMPGADGALDVGRPNAKLDLGKLLDDTSPTKDPTLLQWGPGRLDVTTDDGAEPVRIADLRPVRFLTHLHADATIAQNDVASLAIRIETLIITARNGALRPPRAVALSLARFVLSFADRAPASDDGSRGRSIFDASCATCHAPPRYTGAPIALDVVGTDPTIGLSPNRGTGTYRVPSLHFVGSRGPLLHDASLPDLDALFDPSRLDASYAGGTRGAGPVVGHAYGLDLSPADRAALLSFLRTL